MFSYITHFFYPHKTLLELLMPDCVLWVDEFFKSSEAIVPQNHTQAAKPPPNVEPPAKADKPPILPDYKNFYQALNKYLGQRPFTKKDFVDINAQNKTGLTVLHVAVLSADAEGIRFLLHAGADAFITDRLGRTPLKCAYLVRNTDTFKALLHPRLKNHPEIIKLSDFTFYKHKKDGITSGGFFYDKNHEGWLIKEGHYDVPQSVLNEYVAGGLFQLLLGDNAPRTEMVLNNLQGNFLIGSKLLSNFKTVNDYIIYEPATLEGFAVKEDYTVLFNGKPVTGFFDVLCAISFIADTDGHFGNVGLIDHGDFFSFAKIDHGFSFNIVEFAAMPTLDDFRHELHDLYRIDLESLGYDQVYQAISKVGYMDFSLIETTVNSKISFIQPYFEVLELNDLNVPYEDIHKNNLSLQLANYQSPLLANLEYHQLGFHKMADGMALEKAIREHDVTSLSSLLNQGVSLDVPFKPFFCDEGICPLDNVDVTGRELVILKWPELLEDKPLQVEDILTPTNPLELLAEHTELHSIEKHPSLFLEPPRAEISLLPHFEIV